MPTTFTYTANSTGWAQFYAFPRPGDATTRVGLQGVDCQSVVQDRHGDSSIKMALCTAKITATGNYNLTYDQAAPAGSTYVPVWPTVVVSFSEGGVPYTATVPAFNAGSDTDVWHTGPLAKEAAYLIAPINGSNQQHPLIQVWFDMCGFNDGSTYVSVSVQNVRETASMRIVNLDSFTISISQSVLSSQTLVQMVAPSNRQIWGNQIYTWTGSVGGYTECTFEPPSEMLYLAGLFPRILSSVQNKTDYVHTGAAWEPGGFGDMSDVMENPGGRPELGPVTNATAEWLVHHQKNQRDHIIAQGICSGSWHGNFLRADGKTHVQITNTSESFNYVGGGGQNGRWILQMSHLPQLHINALIITTRKHFLRLMQGWACAAPSYMYYGPATCNPYRMSDVDYDFGIHARGMICNFECIGAGEPRDYWGFRAMQDAAVMSPVGDPVKAYCQQVVQENVTQCDIYGGLNHNASPFNPPEFEFDPGIQGGYGGVHTGYASTSYWQSMYKSYCLWRAALLGYTTNYGYIRKCSQSFLDYLTAATISNWQYVFGFYYVRVAVHPQQSGHSMLTTWAAMFDANFVNHGQLDGNDGNPPGSVGQPYYNLEYRTYLMWCKFLSIPGYETALTYVEQTRGALSEAQVRTNMAFDDFVNPGNVVLPDNNTVVANPTSVPADGATLSTITVTLKDGSNVPLVGKVVTLAAGSGSSVITTVSGTTNGSGVATFNVKDSSAQTVTYVATNVTDSVVIIQQAAVTFTTVVAGPGTISFTGTTSSGADTDPVSTNNSVTFSVNTQVAPTSIADLSISYKVSTTKPQQGNPYTITWTVWNSGPNQATAGSATIPVPGGVTLNSHTETVGSYNSGTGVWSGIIIFPATVAVMTWNVTNN